MKHDRAFVDVATKRTNARNGLSAWHRYEFEKQAWQAANPEATPHEYQLAMNAIAKRLGV